jgi:N-6 DNA Methylase
MLLDLAHERLGWPSRSEIESPPGAGARIFADLAKAKIGEALLRQPDGTNSRVGVLTPNPNSSDTASPLAVVCEFQQAVSDKTLRDLQGLAWNFSRSPMLVTVEPHQLRAWTCCEPPTDQLLPNTAIHQFQSSDLTSGISQRATQVLHWINLVSGQFFKDNSDRFRRDQRADQMLLENLSHVRQELHEKGLNNDDVCHDLLARIIFIQFLFDRKDSSGNSALNENRLERLHEKGVLKTKHSNFASILSDYADCYRLFSWLNDKFNGDLFPGKGNTKAERDQAWQSEKREVNQSHLNVLRDLVSGDLHMPSGQINLWRRYAFDAIPLEFISSIYEAFVNERARQSGIYYTPPHLVDFTLDRVLPWEGDQWDINVLDPACGSGVFLVKAFQRLVHRWKSAHPGETIRADTLRGLLENNLFGVDKDRHAVRVASFSLYLAMCDEIDPKHYWTQVRFPVMREQRLIEADFFQENRTGFRTLEDVASYDLIIGNAPWGKNTVTEDAKTWAYNHEWPVVDKGIGTLFLPKAAALVKRNGKVAMVQPASSLLFNRSSTASEFRKNFFTTFCVEQVVNLSALRFKVFNKKKKRTAQKAVSPSCVVVFNSNKPKGERLFYMSPKLAEDETDEFGIIVEPADTKEIYPDEAGSTPEIWCSFMWGNRRDWSLIQHLNKFRSIEKDVSPENYRRGIVIGDEKKSIPHIKGRHILLKSDFPAGEAVCLQANDLPTFASPNIDDDDSTDFSAFTLPQLIIKKSWLTTKKRFQARLVRSRSSDGLLCTQSYITVHLPTKQEEFLEAACLSYNSILAVYYLLLTSGRFASYRPEPLVEELLRVPVPNFELGVIKGIKTSDQFDEQVRQAFKLKDAEWVLIEDLFNSTLPDYKGDQTSPGRLRTDRRKDELEPQLQQYCNYFIKVLKAGFGQDKQVSATIFQEKGDRLPFRLIAFQLDSNSTPSIQVESLESTDLLAEMEALNKTWLKSKELSSGNIYNQRIARIYDTRDNLPTIFMIKPDACRYWTRSMGLNDADEVAADLLSWQRTTHGGTHG